MASRTGLEGTDVAAAGEPRVGTVGAPAGMETTVAKTRSLWYDAWLRLKRNKSAMFGMSLVILIVLAAIFAPWITRYDPIQQLVWTEGASATLSPPNARHWFGTDVYGRDVFSRVVFGTRISLSIAVAAMFISGVIGTALGAMAGFFGGFVDDVISWLMNVIFAFPFLLFVIAIVAFLPPSLTLVYVAIGVISWVGIGRVVRGQVLAAREIEYVEAARALGVSELRILFRHILPNVIGPVIVETTLGIGNVVMLEAGLSYLGFGTQPPAPSWGYMISQGQELLLSGKWWVGVFPGIAICISVLGFNLFGDGLRDALDPRLKR